MSLGVRSRGFSCHKMASTTAQAGSKEPATNSGVFLLQKVWNSIGRAVKCPQKYNFLICLLRKWIPRPPKLKTSCKVLFCHKCWDYVYPMSPSMSSSVTASSLKVLLTGLIQHGFRHAWGRPQGDPGLENAGNQPETTMQWGIERNSTIRCVHANIRNSRQIKWHWITKEL